MEIVKIDVSQLAPPEPMSKILYSLASLSAQQCLQVTHSREPFPLYEKLSQAGWLYHCQQLPGEGVLLYIYKAELQQALDNYILTC